jgi:hypothetical protein
MTTFDDRLRAQLERLDAAIPAPLSPTLAPQGIQRRSINRRRQGFTLLAAAAVLLTATAIGVVANQPPPDPAVVARNEADEERVRNDLGAAMAGRCLSVDEAKTLFRERLDALGLSSWTIRDDGRTAKSPCVGAGPAGDIQDVLLTPSMGGATAAALDVLEARLIKECVGRDEAVAALRAILVANGIADPQIEVTGIRIVPVEGADAYVKHVKDGCYVYGHAQADEQDGGTYTWFVSGP